MFDLFSVIGIGVAGLVVATLIARMILRAPSGTEKMKEIADAILEGILAFSRVQYTAILLFAALCAAVLWGVFGTPAAVSFLVGACLSALAGIIGMLISAKTNVRVAEAAKSGFSNALSLAFRGGSVTGILVAAMGLLGISLLTLLFHDVRLIIAFGFGASLISLFIRVGGGIYTKAADVGADIVGKVEAGIPEDDPRNPAVIADNVGDNVGDCAGMAADVFESYVVTILAAMLLATTMGGIEESVRQHYVLFPLLISAAGLIASIGGIFFVRDSQDAMRAFFKGTVVSMILFVLLLSAITTVMGIPSSILVSAVLGILVAVALSLITDYFTNPNHSPVKYIARMSETGPSTNILAGLTVGMESTFLPVLVVSVGMLLAYIFAGLYGVAIATTALLGTVALTLAIDAYGPIADNAGGIVEMAKLGKKAREVTDKLDAAGNVTKATTKGVAIGSAALSALVIFSAYYQEILMKGKVLDVSLTSPYVLVGLLIGAALPYLFSAFCIGAVTRAAFEMVKEVRTQLADKEILSGKKKPDYGRCVAISTKASLKELIGPGALAILSPLVIVLVFLPFAEPHSSIASPGARALGGLLVGVIVSGFVVALKMTNTGAAWDNAKKYVEQGNHGGKGTQTHEATIIGDTVGDPYKDTAGPSINALVKVIGTLSLLLAVFA